MSDEGEIDILQLNIAKCRRDIRQLRLRLMTFDEGSAERQGILDNIEAEMRTLRVFQDSLRQHAENMTDRYSEKIPNAASTFQVVDILESLHSRISALESKQA